MDETVHAPRPYLPGEPLHHRMKGERLPEEGQVLDQVHRTLRMTLAMAHGISDHILDC
jgi:hypothetical protein